MPKEKYGCLRTLFGYKRGKKDQQDEEYAKCSMGTRETWEAASKALQDEVAKPPTRTPIVISSSASRRELQRIDGEHEVSEPAWTTTVFLPDEQEEMREIRYCHVSFWQYLSISDKTNGESIIVWLQGKERIA